MLDYEPPRPPLIPWQLLTKDYRVPPLTLSRDPLSCNLDETHLTYGEGAHIKEDKGETAKEESTKEEVQLAKDVMHQVAASLSHVDVAINMEMCIPKEALKEEANKELAQANDHQVLDIISHDILSNSINQEVLGSKSHVSDAPDEEIFISDKEDEAFIGKVNNEDHSKVVCVFSTS